MTPNERAAAMARLLIPFGIDYRQILAAAIIAMEGKHNFVVIVGTSVYGADMDEMGAVLAVEISAHNHGTLVIVPLDDASLQVP